MNHAWTKPVTLSAVLEHIFFLGSFDNNQFDPVLWSLVFEMRISLLFPLIAWAAMRYSWRRCLFIGAALSIFGLAGQRFSRQYLHWSNDYFLTFHFMPLFLLGALLAKHRHELARFFGNVSSLSRMGWLVVAIVLYAYNWLLRDVSWLHVAPIGDYAVTTGAAIVIALSLAPWKFSTFLHAAPVRYLGRISYSLYLFHAIILLAFIHTWYGVLPLWFILILSALVGLVVSAIAHRVIEVPTIELGKRLARRWIEFRTHQAGSLNQHEPAPVSASVS
jgi:peptidoglycan/LPS O-acetylase OafA/YrhL